METRPTKYNIRHIEVIMDMLAMCVGNRVWDRAANEWAQNLVAHVEGADWAEAGGTRPLDAAKTSDQISSTAGSCQL